MSSLLFFFNGLLEEDDEEIPDETPIQGPITVSVIHYINGNVTHNSDIVTAFPIVAHRQGGDEGNFDRLNTSLIKRVASDPDAEVPTFTANTGPFTLASSPTDIFEITGSSSSHIHVMSIRITGFQTSGGQTANLFLIKRSSLNTGGTSAAVAAVPVDLNFRESTSTLLKYTANPTLGASAGVIWGGTVVIPASTATTEDNGLDLNFEEFLGRPLSLLTEYEALCVNLGGVSISGNSSFNVQITWKEFIG